MASGNGVNAWTSTLTASTVDTVVLTAPAFNYQVVNVTGAAPIFFTVDVVGGRNPQPAVNGPNCYCAASVVGATVPVRVNGSGGVVVNLISAGTPAYTVEVADIR